MVDFNRRGSRDDRDDDRGGRRRDADEGRGRDRDDDRGRGSSRDRDRDDDRGGRGSSRGSFEYQARSPQDVRERANSDSKFDKLLKPHVKMWKPNDGDNRIRIMPPTWKGAKHYGYDIHVHYGVGADRQSYLCLHEMKDEPDPIHEEYERFRKDADTDDKDDKQYLKDLRGTGRVLVYLVDRDNEREGVQAWAMPGGLDKDIVKISVDKETGEVLPIDHPDEGYDITFEKNGKGVNTKYEGVSISRRASPLGKREWLEFAQDNPLPDQLQFFDYDHIAREFGGGSGPAKGRGDDRGKDRDERGGRDRDDRGRDRDRDDRKERDRDEKPDYTWASVHDMRWRELEDLVESERLKINPKEAKDDEDLADWVCEELGLKKAARDDRRDDRGARDRDDRDPDERVKEMRSRLSRD